MSAPAGTRPTLFFCVSPSNGSLVFARPERAREVDRLHRALSESRTWGEFRAAMPANECNRIEEELFDDWGASRPADCEPFRPDVVPGFCDGDYPPWLQKELDRVLPRRVLKAFGRPTLTAINGRYVHLDRALLPDILRALRAAGFDVVERNDLSFW